MNEEINIEIVDEDQVNVSTNDGWHELPYEEKDPLFKSSPAYDISSTDITNWNNKSDFSGNYNDLTNKPSIPSKTSDLTNDSNFPSDSSYVHTDNNYTTEEKTKLSGIESGAEVNKIAKIKVNGTEQTITSKAVDISVPTNNNQLTNGAGYITKSVNNLTNYTLKTNTGSLIDLEINTSNYVVTLSLKDQDGTIISTDTIDLPLESVVVGGSYDSVNKKVVLTLENGNTVEFSVADLVAGLQTELTSTNKLNSDYVDDTNSGNKFVTTSEKTTWNAKLDSSDLTDYVKNTDYASSSKGGVIKPGYGLLVRSVGDTQADTFTYATYTNKSGGNFISKGTLENVITGKGLVSNTDYANATTGGVIKTGYYSVLINNYGNLYADTKTYESYQTVGNEHFISKGTLENVLTARIGDISSTLDLINGEVI